jgi:hypothetical protein
MALPCKQTFPAFPCSEDAAGLTVADVDHLPGELLGKKGGCCKQK